MIRFFFSFTCNIRLHTIRTNKITKFVGLSWRNSIMYRSWLALAVSSEMSIKPWATVFLVVYVALLTLLKDLDNMVLELLTSGQSSISKLVLSSFPMIANSTYMLLKYIIHTSWLRTRFSVRTRWPTSAIVYDIVSEYCTSVYVINVFSPTMIRHTERVNTILPWPNARGDIAQQDVVGDRTHQ